MGNLGLSLPRRQPEYRGWRHHYEPMEVTLSRIAAANKERWLSMSRFHPVADSKSMVRPVGVLYPGQHFRWVDGHGRTKGPRYTVVRSERVGNKFRIIVKDRGGVESWTDSMGRCRAVQAQAEDQHSRFSRMLKAAHRRGE